MVTVHARLVAVNGQLSDNQHSAATDESLASHVWSELLILILNLISDLLSATDSESKHVLNQLYSAFMLQLSAVLMCFVPACRQL